MTNQKFTSYTLLDALYEQGILESNFTIDGNIVTDESSLRPIFCLQSQEIFDVCDAESARLANAKEQFYSNYVRLESDDDSSVLQFWGKAKRGVNGEVIIEIRKRIYDMLDCDSLKIFRESRHEKYKGVEQHRLIVVDNVSDGVKVVRAFLDRLNRKRTNSDSTTVKQESVEQELAK